jgi:hypothetical protein
LWGALSDERTSLSFVYAAGPGQVAFLGSESLGTRGHILLSQIWDFTFRRLLWLAGSRWRYLTLLHTGQVQFSTGVNLLAPRYIVSGRTITPKTHPFPSNIWPILLRIRWNVLSESLLNNGYMRTHIRVQNSSWNTRLIVAWVYCGHRLAMDLLYSWLRICCGLVYRIIPLQWVYMSQYFSSFTQYDETLPTTILRYVH